MITFGTKSRSIEKKDLSHLVGFAWFVNCKLLIYPFPVLTVGTLGLTGCCLLFVVYRHSFLAGTLRHGPLMQNENQGVLISPEIT